MLLRRVRIAKGRSSATQTRVQCIRAAQLCRNRLLRCTYSHKHKKSACLLPTGRYPPSSADLARIPLPPPSSFLRTGNCQSPQHDAQRRFFQRSLAVFVEYSSALILVAAPRLPPAAGVGSDQALKQQTHVLVCPSLPWNHPHDVGLLECKQYEP